MMNDESWMLNQKRSWQKLFGQLQEHKKEIIFPFAFVNPVGEIAVIRHSHNRLQTNLRHDKNWPHLRHARLFGRSRF